MLDSSPVALPPVPRPLKRSASTASLPTPPRTHHKRGRGRSRGSCDSDTEADTDNALTSDDEELKGGRHRKKRRTGDAKEEDEEAFWLGDGTSRSKTAGSYTTSSSSTKTRADSPPAAALLYRRRQQTTDVAPVSPPPSHRKPPAVASSATLESVTASSPEPSPATASLPSTPKGKRAVRDSPDNPFLVSPADTPDSSSPSGQSASPHTPTPYYEKSTITYVFRGVRRTYNNPMYNHAEDRPLSPPPNSLLPIEHPDYTPDPSCRPKLLFPAARRQKLRPNDTVKRDTTVKHHALEVHSRGRSPHSRSRSQSVSSREDSDAEDSDESAAAASLIRPKKLDFGIAAAAAAAGGGKKKTWDQERKDTLLKAGERVSG